MAESLGSALLELSTKDAGLRQGIDQAQTQAQRLDRTFAGVTGSIGKSFDGMGARLRAFIGGPLAELAPALAGLGTVAGLVTLVDHISKTGESLHNLSIQTGITVEDLSALRLAADLANTNLDDLARTIQFLQRSAVEAVQTAGDQRDAYQALGISVGDLGRLLKDPIALLETFGNRLLEVTNIGNRNTIALRLSGRAAREMVPFYQDLADQGFKAIKDEATRMGIVLTDKAAKAADDFRDNLGRLKFLAEGFANFIGGPLIENLNLVIQKFLEWAGVIKLTREQALRSRIETGEAILKRGEALRQEAQQSILPKWMQGLTGQTPASPEWLQGWSKDLDEARASLAELQKVGQGDQPPKEKIARSGALPDKDAIAAAGAAAKEAQRQAREDLNEFVRASNQQMKRESEDLAQSLTSAWELTRTPLEKYVERLRELQELSRTGLDQDTMSRAVAQAAIDFGNADAATKQYLDQLEAVRQTTDSLKTAQEKYNDETLRLINLYFQNPGLTGETLRRGFANAGEALEGATEQTNAANDAARQLGLTFSSAFEDAIVGAKSLSDMLKGLLEDLARVLVRIAITQPLLQGLLGPGGGQQGAPLGGLFGAIGNWFSGLFGAQHGASFRVAGSGGPDSQVVAFRATPGEHVNVMPPGAQSGVVVNVYNQTGAQVRTEERTGPGGQRQLNILVEEAVGRALSRTGSASQSALRNNFGLAPALVAR